MFQNESNAHKEHNNIYTKMWERINDEDEDDSHHYIYNIDRVTCYLRTNTTYVYITQKKIKINTTQTNQQCMGMCIYE